MLYMIWTTKNQNESMIWSSALNNWTKGMDSDDTFNVDQLSSILPAVDDNIDSWIHQATWYDTECISHYDQQPNFTAAVPNSTISSVSQMAGSSANPSGMALNKPLGIENTMPSSTTADILNGLQSFLKSNDVLEVPTSGSNDFRTALSILPSGIMNGIFIPSNLICNTLTQKSKADMSPVTQLSTASNAVGPYATTEEGIIEFLRTDNGRKTMAKALNVTEEELLRFSKSQVSEDCLQLDDYHCQGCQCKSFYNGEKPSSQETSMIATTPMSADQIPPSPEITKATSPDSSTAFSDHLSPSPFDTNLAASPEIPIIKREFVEDIERGDCNTTENNLNHSGEKARRHRGTYPKSLCLDVIEFVKQGFSARAAAKKFGIPKSTVHNWLHEDIATRPEKGHRKRAAAHAANSAEAPRLKAKPEMSDSLSASLNVYSHNSSPREYMPSMLGEEFSRKRASESFSSEETDPRSEICSPPKSSPAPGSSYEQVATSPGSDTMTHQGQVEIKVEGEDLSCDFDELLHIDDWIEQEEWYTQQYMKHYGTPLKLRKTYGSYSNSQRKKAVDYVRQGNTISTAARTFSIPKSTIHTWLTEESTPYVLPFQIEKKILSRMEEIHKANGTYSVKLGVLKKVAQDVAGTHVPSFRATYAWCRDFVKRHEIFIHDSKESIDKLCQEEETHMSKPPSMVDFTSFLGLKPTNDFHCNSPASTS